MLDKRHRLAQTAIRFYLIRRRAAAAVVYRDEHLPRAVERQMAGPAALGRNRIQQSQLCGFWFDFKRTHASRRLTLIIREFVDRVQISLVRMHGEERWTRRLGHKADLGRVARLRIESIRVDALALSARIGANVGNPLPRNRSPQIAHGSQRHENRRTT